MTISLTKEQIYEIFVEKADKFHESLEEQIQPKYPFIFYTRDELILHCAEIVKTFIDVVYSEDI